MKTIKLALVTVVASMLLAGCTHNTAERKPYDKPAPVVYSEPDEHGIKHLVNDSQLLEMRGHFCYEISVEDQRPGANCIPTGGVGGASGK